MAINLINQDFGQTINYFIVVGVLFSTAFVVIMTVRDVKKSEFNYSATS
jgi:hypothetical protein